MNTENIYRFVGLALVAASFSISAVHRRRAAQTGEEISAREEGSPILWLRTIFGLGLWLSTLLYFINPTWMAWAQFSLPSWLRWTGAGVMALCVPLFYWLFSSLGKNVTPTVVTRQAHTLVTHGPYRWVRHPLYTVGLLFFVGFCLLSASWFTLLMILGGMPILMARTPIEEAKIIERFGDEYIQYMQKTGRYLPKI
jgi:protein-S-isoprenylcysteine O-methyltransferase Ste14